MKIPLWRAIALVGLALLLVLPAIVRAPMTHDSFGIDWVWASQFTSELGRGNIYPRWLPLSHGGLGSPVFYYYPPLAFYVTGAAGLAGLSAYASIIAAFFLGFVASGFAMYAWLRDSARAPLFGAMLFMASPYHVLDFYGRGALAESLGIALIPLLAIALRRAARGHFIGAALAYAALILTHLPLALLVSLLFAGPYALYLCRAAPWNLLRIGFSLLLGIAISAVYLLPAILLDPFRDSSVLWGATHFKPEAWSLLALNAPHPSPFIKAVVGIVILPLFIPIVVLLLTRQRSWGGYAAFCAVIAAGLLPGFWTLPLIEKVQFPFRVLPLAEFAIATGMAHITLARVLVYAATLPVLVPPSLFLALFTNQPTVTLEQLASDFPDVPENLPPGPRPYSWPSEWALDLSRSHAAPKRVGDYTVERVFYFPAWEVRCQGQLVPMAPEPSSKLLTYKGSGCDRRLTMTGAERVGAFISLVGILFLIGLTLLQKPIRNWSGGRLQSAGERE